MVSRDNFYYNLLIVQFQIVITDSSFEVYTELQKLVPEFRKLSTSRLDSSEANKTIDILNKLIKYVYMYYQL